MTLFWVIDIGVTGSKQNVLTKLCDISCVEDLYTDGIVMASVPAINKELQMWCLSPYPIIIDSSITMAFLRVIFIIVNW